MTDPAHSDRNLPLRILMRAVLPVLLLVGVLNAGPSAPGGPNAWIGQPAGPDPQAVAAEPANVSWYPLPSDSGVRLPSGDTWLKVALSPGDLAAGSLLTISRAPIRIELWLPGNDGAGDFSESSAITRDFFEPDPMRFAPQAFAYDLDQAPANADHAYLKLRAAHSVPIRFEIASVPDFYREAGRWSGVLGAALSALAVMGLINLLFWIRLRDRVYLRFALFIVVQIGWGLFVAGLSPAWLAVWSGLSDSASPGHALLLGSLALLLMFSRGFLGVLRRSELAERVLLSSIVLLVGLTLIHLLPGSGSSLSVSVLTVSALFLAPLVLLWISLSHLRAGGSRSWPLLFGTAPLATALWALAAMEMGQVEPSMLIRVGPFLASAVLSVAMAIALAGRVLDLRVQRDLALRMAETDAMTGLLNRRGGQAHLRDMFRRSREFRLALSVLFIDLDELKPVNDSLGHEAGDACLLGLANLLTEHLPAGAALSRWGGDEFVMLLPGFDSRTGRRLAEDVARHWALTPVRYGGQTIRLTASLGLATLSANDADPEWLLQRADAAVYRAKYAGRNRVEVAEADLISATLPESGPALARGAGQ